MATKKGRSIVWTIIGVAIIFIASSLALSACALDPKEETACTDPQCGTLHWRREESQFVQYEIVEDTVVFEYAICFENHTRYDIKITYLAARFKKSELKKWVEYQKTFTGVCQNDSSDVIIKAGEKVSIPYSFEGKYLGGEVNETLSIPNSILFASSIHDEADTNTTGQGDGSVVPEYQSIEP